LSPRENTVAVHYLGLCPITTPVFFGLPDRENQVRI
jgi:hypothetical protein